jgi:outer membrane protein assembly factor BamB
MRKIVTLIVCLCILPSAPSLSLADVKDRDKERADKDNWPQWRGPLATGFSPTGDPPLKWDEKTNIRWKVRLPGDRGSSTPAVWGDRVFVLAAEDTGKEAAAQDLPKPNPGFDKRTNAPKTYYRFLVLCLDRKTGRTLWKQTACEKVPHEGHHDSHSYAAFSPVTDGKRVYALFGSQGLYCYDVADGKQLWKRDLGRMETRLGWGEGGSPAVHGDTLVVNWDHEGKDFLLALHAADGTTRWKVDRDEPTSWATPLLVDYKGKTQVIVNGTNRVRSYDLSADGKLIWECGGQTLNAIPSPVSAGGVVYVMTGYRGAAAFALPLDATGDITDKKKELWRYNRGTPYVPSPLLAGDRLYFTQRNEPVLTCLDIKTGKPVIDAKRLPGIDSFYASPAGAGDRLYFVGRDGTTLVLRRADRVEVLATNRLDDEIDASPVLVGKQLLLRGHRHLYCIESLVIGH